MVSLLIYGFLFQLVFNGVSATTADDKLNGYRCNDYGVCLPGAEDIAVPPRTILANNTCGMEPYNNYCPLGQTRCFPCNSTSEEKKHPAIFMIDSSGGFSTSNFETWWQSQNWWEWYQENREQPLPVYITLSFNKSYVLTGEIKVTFKFNKPAKMVMEKSTDFGLSWTPLQYFADNCQERFGMEPSDLNCSTNAVLCSERYSDHNEGPLYFSFLNCYTTETFWDPQIQDLTEATDLRLRLEFPATDGLHVTKQENYLQKYFYAISDIQVFGRCQCHGHGENCMFPEDENNGGYINEPRCICRHKTEGVNCEKCQPLYNNKAWMPATSTTKSNPCEKCECHLHADSCTFNATLGHGVCDGCRDNTRGYFCGKCVDKFYRNFSRNLNDPLVCLDCNCQPEGITNNGSCSQEVVPIGQCECKQNVTGRRCDRCEDAYYGYTNPPIGNCIACQCNEHGTVNGSLNCQNVTGECSCKPNIDQRTCSQCKLDFYGFPNTTHGDCLQCNCDYGGSTDDICEKDEGKCLCRHGIQNARCSNVTQDRFFPKYDYFLYEAEYQHGNYNTTSNITEYNKYFTGRGYAHISNTQFIEFKITVQFASNFDLVLRYSDGVGNLRVLVQGNGTLRCPGVKRTITADHLNNARTATWEYKETIPLCPGINYTINVTGKDSNTSVKVDSLLLVPKLTQLFSYEKYRNATIERCRKEFTTISGSNSAAAECKSVTFSTMVELFNGSIACECSSIGAISTSCDDYGGQCRCKQGVMGRTCDRCEPGYYNFTERGCTPCECDSDGSENFVCNADTGQCECKRDVEGRGCDQCKQYYYGIHTGEGCTPCNCDQTGSLNLTCDDVTGRCYCKPGVEADSTDKCDRCQQNYFNFTEEGCQACNCDEAGSRSLQCHNTSGECPCKLLTTGTKCSQCAHGTFSLEKANPSGCIPCFCFNRSKECSAESGYSLSLITQSNLTIPAHGNAKLSGKFLGYRLYSYVRVFQVNLTTISNESEVELHLRGLKHNASFRLTQCDGNHSDKYCVILHEAYAKEELTANQMQSILADVDEVALDIRGDLGNGTQISVAMESATSGGDGNHAGHVERCECPGHYKELSCQNCNTGYTRDISNSNAFVSCVPCSCNNRSKECDGETGKCKECRLSEGHHCEVCGFGVDITTGCQQCLPQYWHPDIVNEEKGCRACNCVLNNTLYHNSSVCNGTTGQCVCKSYVGGLQCERCADNYYNTSHGCRQCPECYGLMQVYFDQLKALTNEVGKTVDELKERFKRFNSIQNNKFARRLKNATTDVEDIYEEANRTAHRDPNDLNTTIDVLDNLESSITQLENDVKELKRKEHELQSLLNKTSNWTETAYESLLQANASRPKIEDLRNAIESIIQLLERAKGNMKDLNETLWSIAQNLSTATQQHNVSRVLLDTEKLAVQLNNNKNNITSLQNKTQASLKYGRVTFNASMTFSAETDEIFKTSEDVLKTVDRFTELIEANRNLTGKLNDSIFKPSMEYETTITNASNAIKDSQKQTAKAKRVLNNTNALLSEMKDIEKQAIKANNSAVKTLNEAITTLGTLEDFQNISANATRTAGKSLQQINNIQVESNRSIKEIMNVSESVQDGLQYSEEGKQLADEAYDLAHAENQGTTSVYKRSKTLDGHHKNTVCSHDLMGKYNTNISTRSQVLTPLLATCPLVEAKNVNDRAERSLNQSEETQVDSIKTNQDVKNVHDDVVQTQSKVESIETVVNANTHQSRVDTHSKLFQSLRSEIAMLRHEKEKRALLIQQMKEQVRTMKLEVQDLQSLRDSFKDLPPCSTT